MSAVCHRAVAPALRLRNRQLMQTSHIITQPRALYSILHRNSRANTCTPINCKNTRVFPGRLKRASRIPQAPGTLIRHYSNTTPPRPTADLLIEELQDLYEIAKDEFEIATESTDGATIYAASDRESARDALNQLCAVYHLYTARPGEDADSGVRNVGAEGEARSADSIGDVVVETNFNPEDVAGEVRDEVRRRVGQRVRELRNAVELLEERAHAE